MPGLLSAMEGFCVIGIVIATGYVAARMRIGGPTAQMVLNRFSFFVSSPCLMFAILSKEKIFEIFHSSIVVAFFSALLVGVVFLILNRLFFHMKAADATIGALNSLYLNSNNIGLPIATYILGNPALVAPILVMQQAVFTPIGLTVLDVTTKGKVSAKEILKQPLHQPLLIGSLLGIAVSAISAKVGYFVIPSFIYDPIDMIGDSAVPMILMAFGMSLHGTKPLQDKSNIPAVFTVAALKNIVMPIIAFLLSYFVMGFRGATLYACVVLAALPTGQNVYNYAARYNVGLSFARDAFCSRRCRRRFSSRSSRCCSADLASPRRGIHDRRGEAINRPYGSRHDRARAPHDSRHTLRVPSAHNTSRFPRPT